MLKLQEQARLSPLKVFVKIDVISIGLSFKLKCWFTPLVKGWVSKEVAGVFTLIILTQCHELGRCHTINNLLLKSEKNIIVVVYGLK